MCRVDLGYVAHARLLSSSVTWWDQRDVDTNGASSNVIPNHTNIIS